MLGVTVCMSFIYIINTRLDWCVIEALRGNTLGVTSKSVAIGVSLRNGQHVMGGGNLTSTC